MAEGALENLRQSVPWAMAPASGQRACHCSDSPQRQWHDQRSCEDQIRIALQREAFCADEPVSHRFGVLGDGRNCYCELGETRSCEGA